MFLYFYILINFLVIYHYIFLYIYSSLHNYWFQVYIWHCFLDILNVFHGGSCLIKLSSDERRDDVKGQVSDVRDVVVRN